MRTDRGKTFEQHTPTLDPAEMATAFASGHAAISLAGHPMLAATGIIEYLAVKFALEDGSFVTVLLDEMSAGALKALVEAADSVNWDGNTLRPGPTSH